MILSIAYFISTCVFVIFFGVFPYRRQIVRRNLMGAFPKFTLVEIKRIERKFFHQFLRLIAEILALRVLSKKFVKTTYGFPPSEAWKEDLAQHRRIVITMGHFGNWEWASASIRLEFPDLTTMAFYRPIKSRWMDEFFWNLRTRFGTVPISMHQPWPMIKSNIDSYPGAVAIAMVADQSAPPENAYRTLFMGRESLFYWGPERFAKRIGAAFYFGEPRRLKDGSFEMHLTRLATAEEVAQSPEGELTDKYVRALEKAIYQNPEQWIWSHRKWR